MKIVMDFETRSPVDIKKCGAYVYANHPMTDVLMLAVVDAAPDVEDVPRIWVAPSARWLYDTEISDEELTELVTSAELLIAHNAPFERWIWEFIMHRRLGFPKMPIEKFFCTMSQALMCGFPRKLENAIKAIAPNGAEKDMTGHKLMLKLSKPRKFVKADLPTDSKEARIRKEEQLSVLYRLSRGGMPENGDAQYVVFHEKKDEYARFIEYCKNDVIPEKVIYNVLPKSNAGERDVWILDQEINDRGFCIDVDNAKSILNTVIKFDEIRTNDAMNITDSTVSSMKSPKQIMDWLRTRGIDVTSVAKDNIEELLTFELPEEVRAFLEIRGELGKSSTAKYDTMICQSSTDSRCHGNFIYHGATTARWSGAGLQPQNLPRLSMGNSLTDEKKHEYEITEDDISLLASGDIGLIQMFWKNPMILASDVIRSMIIAPEGKTFYCADFSAIEGRGLAWLAGEETSLDAYRKGLDAYKVAASGIFKIPYEQIDGGGKGPQRQIGKTAELACGYGGGYGAMCRFGADKMGIEEEEGKGIVKAWREAHPFIVALWHGYEDAAFGAVESRGAAMSHNGVFFKANNRFLNIKLPSGRFLFYPLPRIERVMLPWEDRDGNQASKMGVTSMCTLPGGGFIRLPLNYIKLSENVTQATCRDILKDSMVRLEKAGYPTVMHVHDEIISEVDKGFGSLKEFIEIMSEVPEWAKGFPIKAEGWEGKRYRK